MPSCDHVLIMWVHGAQVPLVAPSTTSPGTTTGSSGSGGSGQPSTLEYGSGADPSGMGSGISSSSSDSHPLSPGAIAGIVVACVAGATLVGLLAVLGIKRAVRHHKGWRKDALNGGTIPMDALGIGINPQPPGHADRMRPHVHYMAGQGTTIGGSHGHAGTNGGAGGLYADPGIADDAEAARAQMQQQAAGIEMLKQNVKPDGNTLV